MPNRIFSPDQELDICETYKTSRLSVTALAKKLNCAPHTISSILKKHDIPLDPAYRRTNLYPVDSTAFQSLDNEQAAYWLGFIYADGHITNNSLHIRSALKDKEHINKIQSYLKSSYPIYNQKTTAGNGKVYPTVGLTITDFTIAERLQYLGIVNNRTNFESTLANLPSISYPHFIRGLFDGDGCAAKNRTELIFCGNPDILTWIRDILSNTLSTKADKKIYSHKNHISYLSFGGRLQMISISTWLYASASIWLERKKDIIDHHIHA